MLLLPFPVELWTLSNSSKKKESEKEMRAFAKFIRPVLAVLAARWRWEKDWKTREEEKLFESEQWWKMGKIWHAQQKVFLSHEKFMFLITSVFILVSTVSLSTQFHICGSPELFSLRVVFSRTFVFCVYFELWVSESVALSIWFCADSRVYMEFFFLYIRRQSIDSHPFAIVLRDSQTNTFIHYTKRTRIMIFSSRLWVFYESENQRERAKKREHRATTEKNTFPPLIRIELVNQNVSREFGAVIKNIKNSHNFLS